VLRSPYFAKLTQVTSGNAVVSRVFVSAKDGLRQITRSVFRQQVNTAKCGGLHQIGWMKERKRRKNKNDSFSWLGKNCKTQYTMEETIKKSE
jgi:hypothetical protein